MWGYIHVALMGLLGGLAFMRLFDILIRDGLTGAVAFPAVVLALAAGLVGSHFAYRRQVALDILTDLLEKIKNAPKVYDE